MFKRSRSYYFGKRSQGFALLETLVAAVVLGFGLMALGKFQSVLIQNTGFIREQNIGLKLAQAKIDELRIFTVINAPSPQTTPPTPAFNSIASGSDTPTGTGSTTFTRNWTVTNVTESGVVTRKDVVVNVSWTDSASQTHTVSATTIISADDLSIQGNNVAKFTPPGNPVQPFNRVLKVPVPAVNNGDGTSTYTPFSGGPQITLSNTTGLITNFTTFSGLSYSSSKTFFLLSGYVSFGTGGNRPNVNSESNINFRITTDAAGATILSDSACFDDSAVASGSKSFPGVITWGCVVGVNTPSPPDTPKWSGWLRLQNGTATSPSFGWSSNDPRVCRFNATLSSYSNIDETLSNQNFIIVKSNSCTSGTVAFQP